MPATPLPEALKQSLALLQQSSNREPAAVNTYRPTLFTTTWCGYCRKARAYFAQRGIAYHEYDVETARGVRALAELGGGKGVPILFVRGRRISGFSAAGYDAVFRDVR